MDNVRKKLGLDVYPLSELSGENITVAILDTGISKHPDFDSRIIAFKDIVNKQNHIYDDNGHGTHVAGIISGSGLLSNNRIKGIAPKTKIVAVKVLNRFGIGKESDVVEGIRWIIDNRIKYNIQIVNISFGTVNSSEIVESKMMEAVELLWDLGMIVIAAAGNNGPKLGSITAPGCSKKVITVGAYDDGRKVSVNGKYISDYSGRGPTIECIQKPDVITIANNIKSCNNDLRKSRYVIKSGTSMAAPVVSGVVALSLEINDKLTGYDVKNIIRKTSVNKNLNGNIQGWGMLNPLGLMRMVKTDYATKK